MKKEFNPDDWLPKTAVNSEQYSVNSDQCSVGSSDSRESGIVPSSSRPIVPSSPHPLVPSSGTDIAAEVDTVIARIEADLTDITSSYADWLNVGFAFAHEFGEAGRNFYHRVSRFYNGYTRSATDKQYDQCLHSHGNGITISTFFYLAKQAGVEVRGRGDEGTTARGSDQCSVGSGQSNNSNPSNPSEGSDQWSVGSSDSREFGIVPSPPRPIVPSDFTTSSGLPSPDSGLPTDSNPSNPSEDSDQCSVGSSDSIVPSPPRPLVPSSFPDPSPDSGLPIEVDLPPFPDHLFPTLPEFLQRVVERCTSKEERDILLLGSLTTLSACLYKVVGIYDDKKVFPNLFLYVTAKASAGKGRLVLCKRLVQPVHWSLREQSRILSQQYEMEMREFNLVKNKDLSSEKPQKPPEKLLFIPANSSSTGMFQLLWDNNGHGLIFETEGDTLAQAFKTDYGNYSDGFRKAFHHETITYYRRTDREYVEIAFPCISTVLSGTPRQVAVLIPNAENGLFSRFMFYYMNLNPVWKNVFASHGDRSLDEHFNELGKEFYSLYTSLCKEDDMEFRLTAQQEEQFHSFFTQVHEKYLLLQGIDYLATIRRLGLNAFRICMILSALRLMETGDFTGTVYCRDEDFQSALDMIRVLVRHASHVYSELPEEIKQVKPKNKQELFLESLPASFTHQDFAELAKTLGIPLRTAERYITLFCEKGWIVREALGNYINKNRTNDEQIETKENQP